MWGVVGRGEIFPPLSASIFIVKISVGHTTVWPTDIATERRSHVGKQYTCNSKEETQSAITRLGKTRRRIVEIEQDIAKRMAKITAGFASEIDGLKVREADLSQGIEVWCTANRAAICPKGSKTANLVVGKVSWRKKPDSLVVEAQDMESIFKDMRKRRLKDYIVTKQTLDKGALLKKPEIVARIDGLSIEKGVENFGVEPFGIELDQAA